MVFASMAPLIFDGITCDVHLLVPLPSSLKNTSKCTLLSSYALETLQHVCGCCAHCKNSRAMNVTSNKLGAVWNERVQNMGRIENIFFVNVVSFKKKSMIVEQEPSELHLVSKCHHFRWTVALQSEGSNACKSHFTASAQHGSPTEFFRARAIQRHHCKKLCETHQGPTTTTDNMILLNMANLELPCTLRRSDIY